mmetsp:Transcript_473/g.1539  ORF Transcript_473/g.1539 Transcript_473/m.1539 type:complete len:248 (-) Transcript_473:6-749(-)
MTRGLRGHLQPLSPRRRGAIRSSELARRREQGVEVGRWCLARMPPPAKVKAGAAGQETRSRRCLTNTCHARSCTAFSRNLACGLGDGAVDAMHKAVALDVTCGLGDVRVGRACFRAHVIVHAAAEAAPEALHTRFMRDRALAPSDRQPKHDIVARGGRSQVELPSTAQVEEDPAQQREVLHCADARHNNTAKSDRKASYIDVRHGGNRLPRRRPRYGSFRQAACIVAQCSQTNETALDSLRRAGALR